MLRSAIEAQQMLAEEWGVASEVWSAPSYKLLREDALSCERWNRLHPEAEARVPYVTAQLGGAKSDGGDAVPVVAVSDFLKLVPDQIGRFVGAPFTALGTDGFGYSDVRGALRRHFEVDAAHITVAALAELARAGQVPAAKVAEAIARYELDADAPDPRTT
jgi:pyruvate dehydrogenase E1 component